MRRPAGPFRLLADPVLALNHEWLFGRQLQMKTKVFRNRVERLIFARPTADDQFPFQMRRRSKLAPATPGPWRFNRSSYQNRLPCASVRAACAR